MGSAGAAARIAVVGGGIAGAFSAYFLARAGADVTLIEREEIGGQASRNNPGGLNPLHGPGIPGPLQPLALEAFRLHLETWDDVRRVGIDFGGHKKQRLNLAVDDGDVAQLVRMKESYDATPGFSARWLEPDEAQALEPRLDGAVVRGLLAVGDAKVDPGPYTRAVARAAEMHGATTITAEVRDIVCDGERATGLQLDSGSISCDGVVIATGAWCDDPARWLGVALPIEPVKGEMLLVEATGGGVQTDLAWRDTAVYQTSGTQVWLGGTEDRVGFDSGVTESGRTSILERVARVMPAMAQARVVQQTAGLRPVTPDGLPIVGIPRGVSNVCVVLGGGRKGMLFGAAMGRAAADLLTEGSSTLSIAPCSADRFA